MKIGIIGPYNSCHKIKKVLLEYNTNISIKLYIRQEINKAYEVIKECESECDAIIFTGIGVYQSIVNVHNIIKPFVYISRGGTSIFKALWQAKNDFDTFTYLSVDVVDKVLLEDILKEVSLEHIKHDTMPFMIDMSEDDYYKWHLQQATESNSIMFTGFVDVYKKLKSENHNVYLLEPTTPLIKNAYDKLIEKIALNSAKESMIGVELISVNDYDFTVDNYYNSILNKTFLDREIIEYARNIQGTYFNYEKGKYLIFANKGVLDNGLNYELLNELQTNISKLGYKIKIGIGIGNSAYQAEVNATKAIKRDNDSHNNYIYLIDENDNVTTMSANMNLPIVNAYEVNKDIIDIVLKTHINQESIIKIKNLTKLNNSKNIDTKVLANYLGISDRSARRVIAKLIDNNYAKVVAKESLNKAGRPKNLIEILF
ncbi:hypothetical protein [Mycoplasma sp. P36-A1]|uniref:hypothetical protein n=1 Tax=Mycoplasma sp. P36-A1 TaxID=3252900 RepID=UPI003C2D88F0